MAMIVLIFVISTSFVRQVPIQPGAFVQDSLASGILTAAFISSHRKRTKVTGKFLEAGCSDPEDELGCQ
jgi:hypothetical protein